MGHHLFGASRTHPPLARVFSTLHDGDESEHDRDAEQGLTNPGRSRELRDEGSEDEHDRCALERIAGNAHAREHIGGNHKRLRLAIRAS